MTTGELLKLILKFFKTHKNARPVCGDFIGVMKADCIFCCGLSAAYLQTHDIKDELARYEADYEESAFYDAGDRVRSWLHSEGINRFWVDGFIDGFDLNKSSNDYYQGNDNVQYTQGYKAGRSINKRLFKS